MNYKSSFKPCELQCPVTLKYVDFDKKARNLLDLHGYTQLDFKNAQYVDENHENAVLNVPLLINGTPLLSRYVEGFHKSSIKTKLQEFVTYVGSDLAQQIVVQFNK